MPPGVGCSPAPRFAIPADPDAADGVRVVSLDRAVEIRLEEGLHRIEDQTASLMREVAAEMWKGSGADAGSEQDRSSASSHAINRSGA